MARIKVRVQLNLHGIFSIESDTIFEAQQDRAVKLTGGKNSLESYVYETRNKGKKMLDAPLKRTQAITSLFQIINESNKLELWQEEKAQ
ncbi:hypothetical protein MTR_3g101090 [Medicago truncatula]|uniref:Uncharacterized protein n=1 Tax=Medicago truncatula TaxID=3880 RepID=G7J5R5_MEDTR|nr:hypothetical protein MTR_3g101090 [Medicago truncatula]